MAGPESLHRRVENLADRLKRTKGLAEEARKQRIIKPDGPETMKMEEDVEKELAAIEADYESLLKDAEVSSGSLRRLAALEENLRRYQDLSYDWQKHLTTLSTAAIVGIVALLEIVSPTPELRGAVLFSVTSLLISIAASVFVMFGEALAVLDARELQIWSRTSFRARLLRGAERVFWVGVFFMRIVSLSAFLAALSGIAWFCLRSV